MNIFSYIIVRDNGSNPNIFAQGYLILPVCKPDIRRTASVGDLVVGLTERSKGNELLWMGKVSEKWPKRNDPKGKYTLIFEEFTYFGRDAIALPERFSELIVGRAHRRMRIGRDDELIERFTEYFEGTPRGVYGRPRDVQEGLK